MRKTRNNTHQPVFDVSFHDHEIEKSPDHMPALTTPHDGHFLEISRICRSLKRLQRSYARGDIGMEDIRSVVHSWLAHASHADTFGLRNKILSSFSFAKGGAIQ